ncbi:helix-turn-helix domain-containing protein [Nocardia sp. NPDC050630]
MRGGAVREIVRRLGRSPSTISRESQPQRRDSRRVPAPLGYDRSMAC